MDYSEVKLQQLDAAATYRVYGHELDFAHGGSGAAARLRWRLILPCFCVRDAPDSPCRCVNHDDPYFWWLVDDSIVHEGDSGRIDPKGKELKFFDVLLDSQILAESTKPLSARALKNLGDTVSVHSLRGLGSDSGSGVPGTSAKPFPPWVVKLLIQIVAYLIDKFWDEITKPFPFPKP